MNPLAWARAEVLHFAWQRGLYLPPDRRIMEREILGTLAADQEIGRVLFVGVQWYTKSYPAPFRDKVFATIDPNPALAQFGSGRHAIGVVQDLASLFPGERFDAIVMSGVIGFGLNDPHEVDRAIGACADALRPGGYLVLGINEEKPTHVDPRSCPSARGFVDAPFGSEGRTRIDVRLPFRERRHTFLFWRRAELA